MRSAISRLLLRTKGELLLFERLLKHVEHGLEGLHANRTAADRSEMLFAVHGAPVAAGESHVDEAFLMAWASWTGETGDAQCDVRFRALQRALRHRTGDDLRDRFVVVSRVGAIPRSSLFESSV